MEIMIQLAQPSPGGTHAEPPAEVRAAVAALGLTLEPVHAGSTDPASASYFRVPVADRPTGERVVKAVTGLPAVATAYFKPTAQPA
jgi:hypothetical protein